MRDTSVVNSLILFFASYFDAPYEGDDINNFFNGFYQVRRNAEWRKYYYQLFEKMKPKYATFEDILDSLYEYTGRIEASFASKMLATLHPDQPIWDKYVIYNLGLDVTKKDLDGMVDVYEEIVEWYGRYIKSMNGQQCIRRFDEVLPTYAWISDVEKVDDMHKLWKEGVSYHLLERVFGIND